MTRLVSVRRPLFLLATIILYAAAFFIAQSDEWWARWAMLADLAFFAAAGFGFHLLSKRAWSHAR